MKIPIMLSVFLTAIVASAHQSHHHANTAKVVPPTPDESKLLIEIGESYSKNVHSIFESKCFDCHSSRTNFPWYHIVPGIKQFIDSDVLEAKKHLDMENGFPFKSHATPKEDLEAIQKCVQDEAMPPFRYRLLHPSSKLSEDEKLAISTWVNESLKRIP